MNEALLEVVGKMLHEDKSCSKAMDFVPRPGAYLNLDDVRKELEGMAKRLLTKGSSYWICQLTEAYKWRTEAEIAGQRIP